MIQSREMAPFQNKSWLYLDKMTELCPDSTGTSVWRKQSDNVYGNWARDYGVTKVQHLVARNQKVRSCVLGWKLSGFLAWSQPWSVNGLAELWNPKVRSHVDTDSEAWSPFVRSRVTYFIILVALQCDWKPLAEVGSLGGKVQGVMILSFLTSLVLWLASCLFTSFFQNAFRLNTASYLHAVHGSLIPFLLTFYGHPSSYMRYLNAASFHLSHSPVFPLYPPWS